MDGHAESPGSGASMLPRVIHFYQPKILMEAIDVIDGRGMVT
jgi:hypothetical protein